jgi:4-diphosphocytidyl-2-C-methyl-D-erythritol kinase
MKTLFDVPAPAKLNLFLHIVGRRSDGYHLLESAFMLMDWYDTLHFELRPKGGISREDLSVLLPANDLIVRAAHALVQHTGCTQGVHISVEKRIPTQAGMGGGSSDAASTLIALNRLWALDLPLKQLTSIGLTLGADVPFFLGGHNAWVTGIGEKLTPISIPVGQFIVLKPSVGIDTAQIFSHPDLKRNSESAKLSDFLVSPFNFGDNALQHVSQLLCQDVKIAIDWLQHLGFKAKMTGSGSAVFAHVSQDAIIPQAPRHFHLRVCHSLAVHPLQGWCV